MGYVNSNQADDDSVEREVERMADSFDHVTGQCVSDDTARWNTIVAKLYNEIDDADTEYAALYVRFLRAEEESRQWEALAVGKAQ